ncbi:MAG: amidase [Bacteroidetes bacterium]|nr:amidase [Bacteroidota bacterium]
MKRKKFISNGSLLGLVAGTLSIESFTKLSAGEANKQNMQNYVDEFELNEITIDELQQKMSSGKLTALQLAEIYLKRIDGIDKNGIALKSVIEINPTAIKEATILDEERKSGTTRGLLHGIPVLIKDNMDVENMNTTAGSLALDGNKPAQDAFLVKQLRQAGAVILGKTNLSEWANIRSENSSSGWSSRGGQTKNPYILDRNPCGSSSGSAVAVSANLCAVAIGTETDGSIVAPASVNGVVGLKPTVGLISRTGIIPISETQDTAGPIARTVKDAAILLGVITGIDENDNASALSKGKTFSDYTKFLQAGLLKGKRIGVEAVWSSKNTKLNLLFHKIIQQLKSAEAVVVEIQILEPLSKLGDAELEVLLCEFKDGLNKYLSKSNAKIKTLADLIAFNKKEENVMMPFFQQEIFENAEKTDGLKTDVYLNALSLSRDNSRKIIDEVMSKNNLDAIMGLTSGPACTTDLIYGDHWGDISFSAPAAMAGYPHITVPAGFVYDLPVGVSFFSEAYSEPKLLGIAYAFEQLFGARKKPEFKSTLVANKITEH